MSNKTTKPGNNTTETTEKVTVLPLTFKVGKDSRQTDTPAVNMAAFVSELGGIIRKYSQGFTLRVFGQDMKIPAETSSNSPLHRTYAGLRQLTNTIFTGMESETVIADKDKKAVLQSFQAIGFKFTSYTKASVNEAVSIWWKNKAAKIALIKVATRRQNCKLIAETAAVNEAVKAEKTALATELTGFKAVADKTAKGYLQIAAAE